MVQLEGKDRKIKCSIGSCKFVFLYEQFDQFYETRRMKVVFVADIKKSKSCIFM